MRLQNEDQLLDINIRAKIIEEIESPQNRARKDEHFKRYRCYKDDTDFYVIKKLLLQFDPETVQEMSYALSDIAFVRKIIDKLARVYKYGVTRSSDTEQVTQNIQELSKLLSVDKNLKKTNRFYKLCRNTLLYICPKSESFTQESKKSLKVYPLLPFFYDAVEQYDDREKPGCIILSDYESEFDSAIYYSMNPAAANRGRGVQVKYRIDTENGVDEVIADAPSDQKNYSTDKSHKTYVFWSDSYHFTCDSKGNIISEGDGTNPIGEMPFVNYAEDQDGSFWAFGGKDLTDGSVLLNSMITNVNHIGITQGYGQLVMTGENLPTAVKVGPNKLIRLEYKKDENPVPTLDFKSANPPLDQLKALIEMYAALLLTTNNLSTNGVSASLDSNQAFPSGIAMMLDKAESMEDVEDQRQVFVDNEPLIWAKIAKWMNVLKITGELSDELSPYMIPLEPEVKVKFGTPAVIQTDKERIETLKLKNEAGIVSKLDMLRSEYPDYTDEQLAEKLEEIMEEKQRAVQSIIGQSNQPGNLVDSRAGSTEDPEDSPGEDQEGSGRVSDRTDSE